MDSLVISFFMGLFAFSWLSFGYLFAHILEFGNGKLSHFHDIEIRRDEL